MTNLKISDAFDGRAALVLAKQFYQNNFIKTILYECRPRSFLKIRHNEVEEMLNSWERHGIDWFGSSSTERYTAAIFFCLFVLLGREHYVANTLTRIFAPKAPQFFLWDDYTDQKLALTHVKLTQPNANFDNKFE